MQSAYVLLECASPRDGHSQEQRVEPSIVKALPYVAPGCDDYALLIPRHSFDLRGNRITLLLTHSPFHFEDVRHTAGKFLDQDLQVVGPLGKHQWNPALRDTAHNIGDDEFSSLLV